MQGQEKKNRLLCRLVIFDVRNKQYSEQQIEDMEQSLKEEYLKIREEYDEKVEEEFMDDYLSSIGDDENVHRESLLEKGYVPPAMQFPELSEHQKLSEVIPVGEAPVPMPFWIPIAQSITTKERQQLSHAPYLPDKKMDAKVHRQLCSVFAEGIHGMLKNWNDTEMNDWLMYKLMRKMLEEHDFSEHPDLFYYCVYRLWPSKWTQQQLSEGFPALCEMYAEEGYDAKAVEPWKPDPKQVWEEDQIDCYSCLENMCPTHGFAAKIAQEFPGGQFYEVKVPLPDSNDQDYCSNACWKMCDLDEAVQVIKATDEEKTNLKVTAYINKLSAIEADTEEGLLAAVFGVNTAPFCKFALMSVDPDDDSQRIRTCRDAYECILKIVERPSAALLELSKPSKQLDYKTRVGRFRTHWQSWSSKKKHLNEDSIDIVAPIVGCSHPGPCGGKTCQCSANGVCSHLCSCDVNCKMRFPGCICRPGNCKTNRCQCVRARWECNPKTCKYCNNGGSQGGEDSCANFPMTRMHLKKIYVAPSTIAGHGLFLGESAKKDEFIVEYVGERITHNEAERRGAIYDLKKCSYLFNLKTGGAIDAFKVGNEARFVNHSDHPTCYASSVMVAGEERIAFFAGVAMQAGTELTFDYGYSGDHQKIFNKTSPNGGRKRKRTDDC